MTSTLRMIVLVGMLVGGMLVLAPAAHADPVDPPNAGHTAIVVNAGAQYCLHPTSLTNGAPVELSPCDLYRSNTWDVIYLDDHRYFIRVSDTNKCLTTPEWADFHAVLYECYGYADQQWYQDVIRVEFPIGWLTKLRNVAHEQCLVGPNWAHGAAVLYYCQPHSDQEWWLRRVG
jgi:hypothetical protein